MIRARARPPTERGAHERRRSGLGSRGAARVRRVHRPARGSAIVGCLVARTAAFVGCVARRDAAAAAGVAHDRAHGRRRGRSSRQPARRGRVHLGHRRLGHPVELPRVPGAADALRRLLQGHRALRRAAVRAKIPRSRPQRLRVRRSIGGRHDAEAGVLVRGGGGVGFRRCRVRATRGCARCEADSRPTAWPTPSRVRSSAPLERSAPPSGRRSRRAGTRCTRPRRRSGPRSSGLLLRESVRRVSR